MRTLSNRGYGRSKQVKKNEIYKRNKTSIERDNGNMMHNRNNNPYCMVFVEKNSIINNKDHIYDRIDSEIGIKININEETQQIMENGCVSSFVQLKHTEKKRK